MAGAARPGTRRPRSPRRRRFGRGLLLLLGGLMLGSGLLRLGSGTGAALAREVAGMMAGAEHGDPLTRPPETCEPAPGIAALLSALQARESAAEQREAAIAGEMLALARAREEVTRQMEALTAAEAQLEATLALADGATENDLAKLTAMYEQMKPKEAAALFAEMEPSFAAGFLGRMRPDAAAAVMAGMEPRAAYTVSLLLAGRNGTAPTE